MDDHETALLSKIPANGSAIGNTSVMRALEWAENEYWEVRNRLVDRGALELGRGKGGSVRRVLEPAAAPQSESSAPSASETPPNAPNTERPSEAELYEPIKGVLEGPWVRDKRFESAIVQVTALQGRRATGGKWTRPDISVATLSTYPYVPGRHFDLVTFEVKPQDAIDVTAVYEALAHLRAATRAYVLLHVPDNLAQSLEEVVADVSSEAKKHGIGVIVMGKPDDYETWEENVEAKRFEPEPRKLNDFLAKQLTHEQLERLVRWFR
ncbi:MAG: hypothetical protein ABI488_10495 [Polyangiaceae bacterium]